MSKHYYIGDRTQPRGFVEVGESEFFALAGDEITRPYVKRVYRGEMSIDDVPEALREVVSTVVAARTERFGAWSGKRKKEPSAEEVTA